MSNLSYSITVFIYKSAVFEVSALFDYEGAHIHNLYLLLVVNKITIEKGIKPQNWNHVLNIVTKFSKTRSQTTSV